MRGNDFISRLLASQSLSGSALGLGTDKISLNDVSGIATSVMRVSLSSLVIFNW
jgi:hypothetical protein